MASAVCSLPLSSSFAAAPSSLKLQKQQRATVAAKFVVRAEASSTAVNPSIQKDVEKVVDAVNVAELSKPITAYCRCWRSKTFPLCDGTHVKYNKESGDNVGPLVLKK